MTNINRVSDLTRGDDVQVKLIDGTSMSAEYIASNSECAVVVNDEGQFTLSLSNVIWIRKDLLTEGYY